MLELQTFPIRSAQNGEPHSWIHPNLLIARTTLLVLNSRCGSWFSGTLLQVGVSDMKPCSLHSYPNLWYNSIHVNDFVKFEHGKKSWITGHWRMTLTNVRQLTNNENECQGTLVHFDRYEMIYWNRFPHRIW